MDKLLELAIDAARMAGDVILKYYGQVFDVEHKQDGSPVTAADQAAHQVLVNHLAFSELVVVSEEGENLYLGAERYWIVDPLDGTKDFLAKNGEFTVNIALINNNRPVLGVVFAPAIKDMYWGAAPVGAWRMKNGITNKLFPNSRSPSRKMAVSRFHDHPDLDIFAADNRVEERVAIGSALKYGLLAAGEVDVFPRLVGSSEWDTAAGQAVVEAAGGQVIDWHTGEPLLYGKPRRRNPRLLSFRAPYVRTEFVMKGYERELL